MSKIVRLSADAVIERMKSAIKVRNDSHLANELNLSKAAVASWRKREAVPGEVVIEVACKAGVSVDALLFERGPGDNAPEGPPRDRAPKSEQFDQSGASSTDPHEGGPMFDTPEEKQTFDNLLYAIQNIGSGADPALEQAKLRMGCLNAAIETHRPHLAGGVSEDVMTSVFECARAYEAWVIRDYQNASLVRFAVPAPMEPAAQSGS